MDSIEKSFSRRLGSPPSLLATIGVLEEGNGLLRQGQQQSVTTCLLFHRPQAV